MERFYAPYGIRSVYCVHIVRPPKYVMYTVFGVPSSFEIHFMYTGKRLYVSYKIHNYYCEPIVSTLLNRQCKLCRDCSLSKIYIVYTVRIVYPPKYLLDNVYRFYAPFKIHLAHSVNRLYAPYGIHNVHFVQIVHLLVYIVHTVC